MISSVKTIASCRPVAPAFVAPRFVATRTVTSRRVVNVRAQQDDGAATGTSAAAPESPAAAPVTPSPVSSAPATPSEQPPVLQKGQGTAIWTGAISIIFGVAYLAVVFLMDSRGGQMLPPPPEAFIP